MITRDFSVISITSQASLSFSLSLSLSLYYYNNYYYCYYSQKSLTHNIGSASALPIINWTNLSLLESPVVRWRWCSSRQNLEDLVDKPTRDVVGDVDLDNRSRGSVKEMAMSKLPQLILVCLLGYGHRSKHTTQSNKSHNIGNRGLHCVCRQDKKISKAYLERVEFVWQKQLKAKKI